LLVLIGVCRRKRVWSSTYPGRAHDDEKPIGKCRAVRRLQSPAVVPRLPHSGWWLPERRRRAPRPGLGTKVNVLAAASKERLIPSLPACYASILGVADGTYENAAGVAVAEVGDRARWRKSSYSATGDCLEWLVEGNEVRLRDSTDPSSAELHFTHSQWRAFLAAVRNGEADLPEC
jgi:hypothetical protein